MELTGRSYLCTFSKHKQILLTTAIRETPILSLGKKVTPPRAKFTDKTSKEGRDQLIGTMAAKNSSYVVRTIKYSYYGMYSQNGLSKG